MRDEGEEPEARFGTRRLERVTRPVPELDAHLRLLEPVLVRDGRFLLASFHPELTDDTRVHERFLELVKEETRVRA